VKCPNCKHSFKFYTIPPENRVMENWSSRFMCPECSAWLKPNNIFSVLNTSGLIFLMISVVGYVIKLVWNMDLLGSFGGILFFVGIAIFIIAMSISKLELAYKNGVKS